MEPARLFLTSLFLLATLSAQGTPPLFRELARSPIPQVGGASTCVVVNDVDSDEHVDLVIGKVGGRDLLHLGDGMGGFVEAPPGFFPETVYHTQTLALGDVNGDKHLNLRIKLVKNNQLYLNDGQKRFSNATSGRLPADQNHTLALALADFNGNSHLFGACSKQKLVS